MISRITLSEMWRLPLRQGVFAGRFVVVSRGIYGGSGVAARNCGGKACAGGGVKHGRAHQGGAVAQAGCPPGQIVGHGRGRNRRIDVGKQAVKRHKGGW